MCCADLDSYRLKRGLVESEDFILVPAEAWHKLLFWYGMVDDQPALERKVRCKVKKKKNLFTVLVVCFEYIVMQSDVFFLYFADNVKLNLKNLTPVVAIKHLGACGYLKKKLFIQHIHNCFFS